ncbi:MAG: DUF5777 family beta-barrel protein [Leptospira sp.]|nr:DUF5777 family beta-barrel protein [Leptospira sp.]
MKKIALILFLSSLSFAFAQESSDFDKISSESKKPGAAENPKPDEKPKAKSNVAAPPAFKGPNLIHMPTAQPLQKDILDFRFNHRFGNANASLYDFLGLDNGANTQLALDYGITDKLSAGFSRISAFKTYEARTKYFLLPQTDSFPVSIALNGVVGVETEKQTLNLGPYIVPPTTGSTATDEYIKRKFNQYELSYSDRTSYLASILISRRFGEIFSLEVSPMFVHRNFVKSNLSNDRFGLDIGGKVRLNKSFSFIFEMIFTQKRDYKGDNYATADQQGYGNLNNLTPNDINTTYNKSTDLTYVYARNVTFDKPIPYYNVPLSFGLNYDTGGHIYSVFVTNTRALAQTQLLRGADFDYKNREWTIGFNINRFFSFAKEISEDDF